MNKNEQAPVIILTGQEQIREYFKELLKEIITEQKENANNYYFDDEFLSKKEVCKLLKIKQSTFYNMIKNGKINATKINNNGDWKVKYKDLKNLL